MAAERGRVWSDEEIAVLLSAWGEEAIQRQLLGAVRNTIPYKAIAEELRKKGYERDFKQCREKIKALKKKYKEAIDKLRASGVGVDSDDDLEEENIYVNFKWFMDIHQVMGRRAVVSPPALLDTTHRSDSPSILEVTTIEASQVTLAPDETAAIEDRQVTLAPDNEEQPSYSQLSTQAGPSQLQSTQAGPSQLQSTQAGPSQQNTQPGSETEDRPGRKRPRKASKLDRVEKSNKVMMDKFLEAQEKSRVSFLELEEKRMKMEEERERREDSKDERFITFMREMFTMMAPPQPMMAPPQYPPQPPYYPPQPDED